MDQMKVRGTLLLLSLAAIAGCLQDEGPQPIHIGAVYFYWASPTIINLSFSIVNTDKHALDTREDTIPGARIDTHSEHYSKSNGTWIPSGIGGDQESLTAEGDWPAKADRRFSVLLASGGQPLTYARIMVDAYPLERGIQSVDVLTPCFEGNGYSVEPPCVPRYRWEGSRRADPTDAASWNRTLKSCCDWTPPSLNPQNLTCSVRSFSINGLECGVELRNWGDRTHQPRGTMRVQTLEQGVEVWSEEHPVAFDGDLASGQQRAFEFAQALDVPRAGDLRVELTVWAADLPDAPIAAMVDLPLDDAIE